MRRRERGAALLLPVILVITVAAFAVVVAASRSGGDVQSNDASADAIQALYLAETGLERQLKRFATGTACGSLGDNPATGPVEATHTVTDLSTIGIASGSITLVNGLGTDFTGVTALPATQCRIPVTARFGTSNAVRTLHAIVDNGVNLLGSGSNPEFSNPTTAGAPSNWTLNPGASFANAGGPDGTFPACSRSAWHVKRQDANVSATANLSVPVNFTYTGGSNTTVLFHWRAVDRTGGGCAAGVASGPAWPGTCPAAGANEAQACFRFTGTAAPSTGSFSLPNATVGVAVACPDVAGASTFAACATSYQTPGGPAMPTKQSVTVAMAGAGTQTATMFFVHLRLQQVGRREIFIDRIEATNPTALGVARVQVWRDCTTASNPATCL